MNKSNLCKYCDMKPDLGFNKGKPFIECSEAQITEYIDRYELSLYCNVSGSTHDVTISYCPWCGRKLCNTTTATNDEEMK